MLKLREERLKHGYTLKQIGSMIGVSEASVSLYETGKREPNNDTLTFLADLYGVTVDYLLGRDDFYPRPQSTPPLMLDGGNVNGWLEDRPETQMVAAEVMAEAINNGMTKEETLEFIRNFAQLFPEEKKYIMGSMKFLRSQRKEEEEGT